MRVLQRVRFAKSSARKTSIIISKSALEATSILANFGALNFNCDELSEHREFSDKSSKSPKDFGGNLSKKNNNWAEFT